jgi:ChrR Cupin-like domain
MEVSMSTKVRPEQAGSDTIQIRGPAEIDWLPWAEVPGCPGVRVTELWRSGDVHDALIAYQPGASTPGPSHPSAQHHIWVISGSASIAGRRVVAGSYVYVPPDTAHPITEVGPEGCTLLQMHRPQVKPI